MNQEITFSNKYLIFTILFLVLFQFSASVISIFDLPFDRMILASTLISLPLSYGITARTQDCISTNLKTILLAISLSIFSTFLFVLRVNWHIFDLICPTGLLGAVTQVSNGIFPVAFLSFPEIIMNYHQGFIFLSGVLSYLISIPPVLAIKITFIFLFFVLNLIIIQFFILLKNKYYYLVPLLFIGLSSLSPYFYLGMDLDLYNYLNILEQNSSNSWPLALSLIIIFILFIRKYNHSAQDLLIGSLLILSTSTLNATVFSVALISAIVFVLYKSYLDKKIETKHILLFIGLLIAIIIIPRYIPSAFLIGLNYESPQYGIRIFETDLFKYIKHMIRYVMLCGPIVFLSFWLIYKTYKSRVADWKTFVQIMFLISFTFPIFFIFKNIDMWDNLHKFGILSIFLSILIFTISLNYLEKNVLKKAFIFVFICLALGAPATFDMLKNRTALDFNREIYPKEEIQDVVNYLQNKDKLILPYKNDVSGMCAPVGYSAIAQRSGNYMLNSYFDNFLLSKETESYYKNSLLWTGTSGSIRDRLSELEPNTIILVDKKYQEELNTAINQTPNLLLTEKVFKNYVIYEN